MKNLKIINSFKKQHYKRDTKFEKSVKSLKNHIQFLESIPHILRWELQVYLFITQEICRILPFDENMYKNFIYPLPSSIEKKWICKSPVDGKCPHIPCIDRHLHCTNPIDGKCPHVWCKKGSHHICEKRCRHIRCTNCNDNEMLTGGALCQECSGEKFYLYYNSKIPTYYYAMRFKVSLPPEMLQHIFSFWKI